MQEKLAKLLSKVLSNEATPTELQELEEWVIENPQDAYLIDIIKEYWYNRPVEDFIDIADGAHFQHILNKIKTFDASQNEDTTIIKIKRRKRWYIAAAVFIGLSIITTLFIYKKGNFLFNETENVVTTALGAKSQIILPDGSKVWLNAASRLQYDKKFNGDLREVYLDGEAFFDVKKDKNRPFIVHTSAIDIKVLGTSFNVKSYKEEPTIETTLIHGAVRVSSKLRGNIPDIILSPNEKLIFTKSTKRNIDKVSTQLPNTENKGSIYRVSKIIPIKNDSSFVETSWVYNRLLFEGETFKEVAVKMERWFNVKIEFKDTEVENYRLRASFENETVEEALKALQEIAKFKYTTNDRKIIITK